jgi:Ankyrin repeats (3 copies)
MQNRINIKNIKEKLFYQLTNGKIPLISNKTYDLHIDKEGILKIIKESYVEISQEEIDGIKSSLKNFKIIDQINDSYQMATYKEGIDYVLIITFSKKVSELIAKVYTTADTTVIADNNAAAAANHDQVANYTDRKNTSIYSPPHTNDFFMPPLSLSREIVEENMQEEFYKILVSLVKKDEKQCLIELDNFILKYINNFKQEALNKLNSLCLTLNSPNKLTIKSNFLHAVCQRGYFSIVEKLIRFGVDIESSTVCTEDKTENNLSPLLIACQCNHYSIVELLLVKGADFLRVAGNSVSTLMHVEDKKIFQLITNKAKENKKLHELLAYASEDNKTVFDKAIYKGYLEIINIFTNLENFQNYINPKLSLHYARIASWRYPEQAPFFEELCIKLRKYTIPYKSLSFKDKASQLNLPIAYEQLFGFKMKSRHSKDEASKQAIAQAASLLSNPKDCMKYLSFLNEELIRYYHEATGANFPSLNSNSYDLKSIGGVMYPIPKDNFCGIKKEHALERLLISIFKPYGLANDSSKWIAFIPHIIADQMVINGDFVTENQYGAGLFHGITAHMLQQIILIYAIQDGTINLAYKEHDKDKSISVKEFLQAFIKLKIWIPTRDLREPDCITFSDPHRLSSIIMQDGHELGISTLSDSLIDTFCKGFIKLLTAYREIFSSNICKEEFVTKMNDQLLVYFEIPSQLIKYAINYEKKKGRIDGIFGETYAAVKRTYPHNIFHPRSFHETSSIATNNLVSSANVETTTVTNAISTFKNV